jgi:NADPH-dependent glutamate synthase beta subunit-like oxidoreductase
MRKFSPIINDAFCKGCSICVALCPKKRLNLTTVPAASGYLSVYLNKEKYRIPPCNNACPTGEKIQSYIDLIKQSVSKASLRQAWELLTEDNPFPSICGRVCPHPCETACNRSKYEEPIKISSIEKFIGDTGLKESFTWNMPKINQEYQIAIIGGGPAGLSCAYHLRRIGYLSTIFESDSQLGGLLTQGIPRYRLPQNVAHTEISRLIQSDIKVNLNTHINKKDFNWLRKEFDAIFIGIGAHKERRLDLKNSEHSSVIPALKLLYNICRNKKVSIGRRVGIIGGGNAAIDAARSILRLGKKPIVIYRRTEAEMPAIPEEIMEAKEEGVEFMFLAAPQRIIIKNQKISDLECMRMKLGAPDKSGRRTPIPIKNSKINIPLDTIVTAIGEHVDTESLPEAINGIRNGIFSGGDAVSGPATVVQALGAGKNAARLINFYIKKTKPNLTAKKESISFNDLNVRHFEHAYSIKQNKLDILSRRNNFAEIYKGYTRTQTVKEITRCFNCGDCRTCMECELHCPDMGIDITDKSI